MKNFFINTGEIDDDLAWEYDSLYCTSCQSCGDFGCECWVGCSKIINDEFNKVKNLEEE